VTRSGGERTPFRAVFLGAPGAGKGTQAKLLVASAEALHVSTGDMLREHVRSASSLGKRAKEFMDSGALVPDRLMVEMVEDRLGRPDAAGSWILDGFPRTLPQARALAVSLGQAGRELSHVVFFEVPHAELVERLTSRWTCQGCGAIWNTVTKPPARPGMCDACGGRLGQREDDRPAAVRKRLEVYREETEPLLGFYRSAGCLVELDANRPAEVVARELAGVLRREVR
jgi:adenylate kinase